MVIDSARSLVFFFANLRVGNICFLRVFFAVWGNEEGWAKKGDY